MKTHLSSVPPSGVVVFILRLLTRISEVIAAIVTTAGLSVFAPAISGPLRLNGASATNSAVVFIVNKSNPVENLSSAALRKILTSERTRWPDGHKITVVMMERGREERIVVLHSICRMNEDDYSRYLLHAEFTGQTQTSSKELATGRGVVKFVSFVPAAIGYTRLDDLDETVKVVKVDGKAPREPGYPIR